MGRERGEGTVDRAVAGVMLRHGCADGGGAAVGLGLCENLLRRSGAAVGRLVLVSWKYSTPRLLLLVLMCLMRTWNSGLRERLEARHRCLIGLRIVHWGWEILIHLVTGRTNGVGILLWFIDSWRLGLVDGVAKDGSVLCEEH